MTTLALDLGTSLGWALRRPSGEIESGTHDFTPAGHEGEGMRFLRFRAWLHDIKRTCEMRGEPIEAIRYERVDFLMPGQVYAAHVWGGNWATLCAWAEHHGIRPRGIAVGTIKARFCGNGKAKKAAIIAECRRRGFAPVNHDEADALAILMMDTGGDHVARDQTINSASTQGRARKGSAAEAKARAA